VRFPRRFRGLWNALNLITTLGDLTGLDEREKVFMMATMIAFLVIGGYAVSSLTGILSSDRRCSGRSAQQRRQSLTAAVLADRSRGALRVEEAFSA